MTEAECDLRDFPYMPLYIARLRRSKAWLVCKREPALAFYLMNLWMHSWHEVPAGSIENDDDVLADAAMCEPRLWAKIKDKVLRGWVETEGRLFNATVTELAVDAAETRRDRKPTNKSERQKRWRDHVKSASARLRELGVTPPRGATLEALDRLLKTAETQQAPAVDDVEVSRKGREEKGKKEPSLRSGAAVAAVKEPDARDRLWSVGLAALQAMTGQSGPQTRRALGKLVKDAGDDCALVNAVLLEAEEVRPVDPIPWLRTAILQRSDRRLGPVDLLIRQQGFSIDTLPRAADFDYSEVAIHGDDRARPEESYPQLAYDAESRDAADV